MPHSYRFLARPLLLLAGATLLIPSAASAQLGRLKKAASDAVKETAGIKPESSRPGTDVVVTAERLSAVMAVLAPSMESAAREQEAREIRREFDEKQRAFSDCLEKQTSGTNTAFMPTAAGLSKSSALSEKSIGYMQRSLAAQQAKRYREYVALNDSMVALSALSSLAMLNLEGKCGLPVYKPATLIDAEALKLSRADAGASSSSAQSGTVVPAAERAGMSTYQFGMVRERAALWALQQTNNAPVGNSKYGVFTGAEQAVLEAQGAQLRKWAPIFKDQPSTWITWGDLRNW